MKLPVSREVASEGIRIGNLIAAGAASAWAFKTDHKILGGIFAGIGVISAFWTRVVMSESLALSDYSVQEDDLSDALADFCKDPQGTLAKVGDIERALKAQVVDPDMRAVSLSGLKSIDRFRAKIASGNTCQGIE